MFRRNKKQKIVVVFFKKVAGKYEPMDSKKARLEDEAVQFKDKAFVIPKEASLTLENKSYVLFDYDNEKIIALNQLELGYDAKWLDQFVFKKLIAQLVSRIRNDMQPTDKSKILTYIVLFALGTLVGYTVATQMQATATQCIGAVMACL